ncbi:MAG TPA: amidohydrolase family protein [Pseudomonadales bacterium]|nr:amidohydrolase family protein [Pseudomonadales bacterium]
MTGTAPHAGRPRARRPHRTALRTALLLSLGVLSGVAAATDLVITNVTVIDPEAGRLPAMDVLIDGDRITEVRPAQAPPPDVPRIDGEGRYLIPGLWDAHVHLTFFDEIDVDTFARAALRWGVTTLRDTGIAEARMAEARAVGARMPAPNLYLAGPLIDGVPRVYDGANRFRPAIGVETATPAESAALVDRLAAGGADLIKAYEMLTPEQFVAVAEATRRHGLPLTAHPPLQMSMEAVIAAGVREFQHLRNLDLACSREADALLEARQRAFGTRDAETDGGELRGHLHATQRPRAYATFDPARCERMIALLAAAQVHQTPTLALSTFRTLSRHDDAAWRDAFDVLGPDAAARWRQDAIDQAGIPASAMALGLRDFAFEMVPRLAAAGVPIIAGTDSPIGFLTPGLSLHEELDMLVVAGLTPMQALTAATLTPARFMGVDDDFGRVAPGRVADLVLLDADPLDEIRNTRRIHRVIRAGVAYEPESFLRDGATERDD